MRRFLSYIFLILFLVSNLFAQQQEVYKILGISVEGNTVVQPSAIIANSGLKVGDEISFTRVGNILISGDKIRNAIKQLWALRVFKKVSIEIENQVKYFTPSCAHASTTSLTDLIPSLCPATLGNPLFLAHRPFPSIIIAMCLGISPLDFNSS
ncbi:hypothetical protein JGI8_01724 [Candidatus Kryptonium thompsonii]|uniref:Uncharacterized protein n=1 Tax=Candidatus Kryptonium thompsonii TaxID=1633631 RepID=A0ABM9UX37_9BACT|nr:hypothetical protein JGI8_01724 [Candidatus Kryptonium thompsoni]